VSAEDRVLGTVHPDPASYHRAEQRARQLIDQLNQWLNDPHGNPTDLAAWSGAAAVAMRELVTYGTARKDTP
jgi:hypothetical protein